MPSKNKTSDQKKKVIKKAEHVSGAQTPSATPEHKTSPKPSATPSQISSQTSPKTPSDTTSESSSKASLETPSSTPPPTIPHIPTYAAGGQKKGGESSGAQNQEDTDEFGTWSKGLDKPRAGTKSSSEKGFGAKGTGSPSEGKGKASEKTGSVKGLGGTPAKKTKCYLCSKDDGLLNCCGCWKGVGWTCYECACKWIVAHKDEVHTPCKQPIVDHRITRTTDGPKLRDPLQRRALSLIVVVFVLFFISIIRIFYYLFLQKSETQNRLTFYAYNFLILGFLGAMFWSLLGWLLVSLRSKRRFVIMKDFDGKAMVSGKTFKVDIGEAPNEQ